jgi:hypothetical protein
MTTFAAFILLLTFGIYDEAQTQVKISRIGYLAAGSPSAMAARRDAFRQGIQIVRTPTNVLARGGVVK